MILPASAATILPVSNAPIALDAESSEYDRNADRLLFRQVRITQGDLSIAADQAVANDLDFAASTWEFTGHVELDGQGSRIRANSASASPTTASSTRPPPARRRLSSGMNHPSCGRSRATRKSSTTTPSSPAWSSVAGPA